ncbi:MAG: amidophosphoribosyltransferase [Planctomycetota bacterium]
MCGIAAIVGGGSAAPELYEALTVLQHRGQDAAGIVTCHDRRLDLRKGSGLVRDVFDQPAMDALRGSMGLGHVRYPTAGGCSDDEAQPIYTNAPYGVALGHNGNLTNARQLALELFQTDRRHINTQSDSEVLLNVLAHELLREGRAAPTPDSVFEAVRRLHQRCRGAYAAVALVVGHGVIGFRDPYGIRPLVLGRRKAGIFGHEHMLASESVALEALGFELVRDVAPGEAVYLTPDGHVHSRVCAPETLSRPCLFELVYLARPDSTLDDISVYKARLRMGERLAARIAQEAPDHGFDVVMPIPDSGRTAALELANRLGVKYREGFIKNRYIGRTFIMPGQAVRASSVRRKLHPIGLEFAGRHVCLVDDSIVRGTTCKQIVQMARDAGATRVTFCSAAPPVRYPNVYGIDMPAADELVAHERTVEQVRQHIGADRLIYQSLDDLIDACKRPSAGVEAFEDSVFTGKYVTGDVDDAYFNRLQAERNDAAKSKAAASSRGSNPGPASSAVTAQVS